MTLSADEATLTLLSVSVAFAVMLWVPSINIDVVML